MTNHHQAERKRVIRRDIQLGTLLETIRRSACWAFPGCLWLLLCLVTPLREGSALWAAQAEAPVLRSRSEAAPRVASVTLIKSQHARLPLPSDIQRIAVGDSEILAAEAINSRELLVLGRSAGRTTLIVWFRNGTIREYLYTVRRDLSVLQAALRKVHPLIEVEMAPDRDAIVLTGMVPDISYSQAAESVARNYLDAGQTRQGTSGRALISAAAETQSRSAPSPTPPSDAQGQAPVDSPDSTPASQQETVRATGVLPPTGKVINLLQLEHLPLLAEEKVKQAIQGIGGTQVSAHRILRGQTRDDAKDVLVLEGTVPNQVALVRVLSVAAQIFAGHVGDLDDIRVVADEAGAITSQNQQQGQQSGNQSSFGGGGAGALFGGGSSRSGRLNNRIRQNLGRAKVIEAAQGRVLSFIQVTDLPQIRVNIRLYEVNRTKLRTYNPNLAVLASDFNATLGGLGGDGRTTFQNVLAFLGGTLSNQMQFTSGHFAIDTVLSYLERAGLARSLSSPSLTVLSGELAQFQVGGEIPVPEAFFPTLGNTGTGTIPSGVFSSVFFQPFGIELGIRPLAGEDDVITLDVSPQVITPNPDLTASIRQTTGTNPITTAFQTRALRTSARLQDGQALLIGGLVTRSTKDNQSSTPGLREVPGLGWLFKGFDRSDDGFELIVVVNPVVLRDPQPDVPLWEFPGADELMGTSVKKGAGPSHASGTPPG